MKTFCIAALVGFTSATTIPGIDYKEHAARGIAADFHAPHNAEGDTWFHNKDTVTKVGGSWSSWTAWNACSKTCGYGLQTSSRKCENTVSTKVGAPKCWVGPHGRTVVHFDHKLHPSFVCDHVSKTKCACVLKTDGCRSFHSEAGRLHHIAGTNCDTTTIKGCDGADSRTQICNGFACPVTTSTTTTAPCVRPSCAAPQPGCKWENMGPCDCGDYVCDETTTAPTTTAPTTKAPVAKDCCDLAEHPYRVRVGDRCLWSCGAGTTPGKVTDIQQCPECVCKEGYTALPTFDQGGRRVCALPVTTPPTTTPPTTTAPVVVSPCCRACTKRITGEYGGFQWGDVTQPCAVGWEGDALCDPGYYSATNTMLQVTGNTLAWLDDITPCLGDGEGVRGSSNQGGGGNNGGGGAVLQYDEQNNGENVGEGDVRL